MTVPDEAPAAPADAPDAPLPRRGAARFFGDLLRLPIGAAGLALVGLLVAVALAAPLLPLHDPVAMAIDRRLEPPGLAHPFGTDELGRDVLARLVWGARSSLAIGVAIVAIGFVGGTGLGLVAGYLSGTLVEEVVLRAVEVFAAIPLLVWAIAVVGIFGTGPLVLGPLSLPNEAKIVLVVGLLFVPGLARVAHSLAVAEARADYVTARKLQHAPMLAILVGDVLPNILSPMIVQASVLLGVSLVIEASLSFVGLGVQPPAPSWGGMLADAKTSVFSDEWWLSVIPGGAIFLAVIGFNLIGDALRTVLDPRRRTLHP